MENKENDLETKLERLLGSVSAKDRPAVRKWIESKTANGAVWNSLRTYVAAVRKWSPFFKGPMVKATTDDVVKATVALRQVTENPAWYLGQLKEFRAFHGCKDDPRRFPKARNHDKPMDPKALLTREEVQRIIASCTDVRDRALIAVLWDTGARIHEVCALDIEDLQRYKGKDGKTYYSAWFKKQKVRGKERRFTLYEASPLLAKWLQAHPDRENPKAPVFISEHRSGEYKGQRLSPDSARSVVHWVGDGAGLGKKVWPHLFRHSRATDLRRRKVSDESLRIRFGWTRSSKQPTRYVSVAVEDADAEIGRALGFEPVLGPPASVKSMLDEPEVESAEKLQEVREKLGATMLRLMDDPKFAAILRELAKAAEEPA